MRFTQQEKYEIIQLIDGSDLSANRTLKEAGLITAPVLLTDHGKCYISAELRSYLAEKGIRPINGKPYHPQTQGKIERYHRTMKNVIKLENYYSPEDLSRSIGEFVQYYNYQRYHESLNNITPADVYCGRAESIMKERQKTKEKNPQRKAKKLYCTEPGK